MPNTTNFSAKTAGAQVSGVLTDKLPVEPVQPPMGLVSRGPRVSFHYITDAWSSENSYQYYDVVKDENGNSYIAIKQIVPTGVELTDTDYWFHWSDPNAQLEELRDEVATYDGRITENSNDIEKNTETITENAKVINATNIIANNSKNKYIHSISVRTYTTGDLATDFYRAELLTYMNYYGFDTVELTVNFYNQTETSNNPFYRVPVTKDEIESWLQWANENGIRVIFAPHIEINTTPYVWRGYLQPSNATTWFNNFSNGMSEYAELCNKYNVYAFIIASEMVALNTKEYENNWRTVVSNIRAIYKGFISYGANCNNGSNDEINTMNWYDALDFASVHFYPLIDYMETEINSDTLYNKIFFENNASYTEQLKYPVINYNKEIFIAETCNIKEKTNAINYLNAVMKTVNFFNFINGISFWVYESNNIEFPTNSEYRNIINKNYGNANVLTKTGISAAPNTRIKANLFTIDYNGYSNDTIFIAGYLTKVTNINVYKTSSYFEISYNITLSHAQCFTNGNQHMYYYDDTENKKLYIATTVNQSERSIVNIIQNSNENCINFDRNIYNYDYTTFYENSNITNNSNSLHIEIDNNIISFYYECDLTITPNGITTSTFDLTNINLPKREKTLFNYGNIVNTTESTYTLLNKISAFASISNNILTVYVYADTTRTDYIKVKGELKYLIASY